MFLFSMEYMGVNVSGFVTHYVHVVPVTSASNYMYVCFNRTYPFHPSKQPSRSPGSNNRGNCLFLTTTIMAHLDLPRPLSSILLSLGLSIILSVVLLSSANSLAVPSDVPSSLAESRAPTLQRVYSRRQGLYEIPSIGSAHPSAHPPKDTSSMVQFPKLTPFDSRTSSVKMAVDTHIIGEHSNLEANRTVAPPAGAQVPPWGESKYHNSTITTTTPSLVKANPNSNVPTSPSLVTVSQISTSTVPADFTSSYILAVPLAPKINFFKPTPTPSKAPDAKIGSQWTKFSEMHHRSVSKWRFRPRPTITGITIHPTSIPENLISTFFGDLGWARTKGYVIPIDSNGISGWRKVVATETPRSPEGFVGPNEVPGLMTGPSFPSRPQAPSINSPVPQKTVLPTSAFNITYHDNLKIAAVQAFAQLGVVLLAVLVVVVGAVAFVCFSSILRWPMKVMNALRYRDVNMLRDAFVPARFRKGKGRRREKQGRAGEFDGSVRDPGIGKRYLRGTAEAVMFDESSTEGSSTNPSYEGFSSELSESAMSFSTGTNPEAAHDRDLPLTAVVSTGSQSKADGGRLRIINQVS